MRLLEETFHNPQKVDKESMVIRGVKILGRESKNGRTYSDAALDKLATMYEQQSVNVDHDRSSANPERKMSDGFGVLRNIKKQPDGVYGDLHYLREHPLAPVILERAERMPESFGLSHAAEGRVVKKKGKLIVEDVAAVHSVDIVREPATTAGLFESVEDYDMAVTTVREIAEAVPKDTDGLQLLIEQLDAGAVSAETPVEVEANTSGSDQVKAAFRAAVMEAFDDESLDMKATIARIKEIMTAQEKLKPKAKEEPAAEEPAEEEKAMESKESKPTTDGHVLLLEAENLLLKASRDATPERIKAVAAVEESDRETLVESWPKKDGHERPLTSPPKYSSEDFEIPKDTKKFAAWLR